MAQILNTNLDQQSASKLNKINELELELELCTHTFGCVLVIVVEIRITALFPGEGSCLFFEFQVPGLILGSRVRQTSFVIFFKKSRRRNKKKLRTFIFEASLWRRNI